MKDLPDINRLVAGINDHHAMREATKHLAAEETLAQAPRFVIDSLVGHIQRFEKSTPSTHEVALVPLGSAGAFPIAVRGVGATPAGLVSIHGIDPDGNEAVILQHVSQLSLGLQRRLRDSTGPRPPIGFRLE